MFKKKIVLCIEEFYARRKFFRYFVFLINEVREIRKNINVLCEDEVLNASEVDGKRSPLKFFSANILYRNSFTLEPD